MQLALLLLFVASATAAQLQIAVKPGGEVEVDADVNLTTEAPGKSDNSKSILNQINDEVVEKMRGDGLTNDQIKEEMAELVRRIRGKVTPQGVDAIEVLRELDDFSHKHGLEDIAEKWQDELRDWAHDFARRNSLQKFEANVVGLVNQTGSVGAALNEAQHQAGQLIAQGQYVFSTEGLQGLQMFIRNVLKNMGLDEFIINIMSNARNAVNGFMGRYLNRENLIRVGKMGIAAMGIPPPFSSMILNNIDRALGGPGNAGGSVSFGMGQGLGSLIGGGLSLAGLGGQGGQLGLGGFNFGLNGLGGGRGESGGQSQGLGGSIGLSGSSGQGAKPASSWSISSGQSGSQGGSLNIKPSWGSSSVSMDGSMGLRPSWSVSSGQSGQGQGASQSASFGLRPSWSMSSEQSGQGQGQGQGGRWTIGVNGQRPSVSFGSGGRGEGNGQGGASMSLGSGGRGPLGFGLFGNLMSQAGQMAGQAINGAMEVADAAAGQSGLPQMGFRLPGMGNGQAGASFSLGAGGRGQGSSGFGFGNLLSQAGQMAGSMAGQAINGAMEVADAAAGQSGLPQMGFRLPGMGNGQASLSLGAGGRGQGSSGFGFGNMLSQAAQLAGDAVNGAMGAANGAMGGSGATHANIRLPGIGAFFG